MINFVNIVNNFIDLYFSVFLYISFKLGKIEKINLSQMTYKNLILLKKYITHEEYKRLCKTIFNLNCRRIALKRKIKVCFYVFLDTTWGTDCLYKKLERDNRFDVCISLLPLYDKDTNKRVELYYRNKGYKVKKYDGKKKDDDIFFFSTLYDLNSLISYRNAKDQRLSALNIWLPYTFWFDKLSDKLFTTDNAACCWKVYCPSMIHKKIGQKKCDIGMVNMICSGYPKMDYFFDENVKEKVEWKCLNSDSKKIIYAPGYPMKGDENFSTFEMNYMEIYNYAKEHPKETSWIIRPHPILGTALVKTKILHNIAEYNNYLDMWRKLPNGEVSIGGDYYELFKTSDGMILDSISFVSGYQYVNKPLLFLKRKDEMNVNLYGKKLIENVYQAKGNCYSEIYHFIEEVIINGNDKLKGKRDIFFDRYLDYKKHNGKLSCEFIYEDICNSLFRCDSIK